jgi:multiple sugar transport system substrate-binding protein
LVPTPPKTPAEVVADAQAAMKKDPKLKEGLAFPGAKYEGAITSWLTTIAPHGGKLTLSSVDSPGNIAALKWLHDTIYVNKIAPKTVTGWMEAQVQMEFTSGYTAFAINYPFVAALVAKGGPAKGRTGYIPFPPGPGGGPGAALGGKMLAINAKSIHAAAAWKLIQYLTSEPVQIERAVASGDRPSLPAAYTPALDAKAPWFPQVKTLNKYAAPRPIDPNYLQASATLQDAISSVYASSTSPTTALRSAAATIKSGSGS